MSESEQNKRQIVDNKNKQPKDLDEGQTLERSVKRIKFFHRYPSSDSENVNPRPPVQENGTASFPQGSPDHQISEPPVPQSSITRNSNISFGGFTQTELQAKDLEFRAQLEAIAGPLSLTKFLELRNRSGGNVNTALNALFDGPSSLASDSPTDGEVLPQSHLTNEQTEPSAAIPLQLSQPPLIESTPLVERTQISMTQKSLRSAQSTKQRIPTTDTADRLPSSLSPDLDYTWSQRYIGSFQADILVTRSGRNLIKYQEKLNVKPTFSPSQSFNPNKSDAFVRIENGKNLEVGRFSGDLAKVISVLMDTGTCDFKATCIFADDMLRIGDQFYIQLDCYLLRHAFSGRDIVPAHDISNIRDFSASGDSAQNMKVAGDAVSKIFGVPSGAVRQLSPKKTSTQANSNTSFFNNSHEMRDEKILKVRQKAIVTIFNRLSLKPTSRSRVKNSAKAALEMSEEELLSHLEKASETVVAPSQLSGPGKLFAKEVDPDAQSNMEEGEEPNFDPAQLDTVYRRTSEAQDGTLEEVEPPKTFKMSLRPYQKRGLNWMLRRESSDQHDGESAERDSDGNIIEPMHPLWQEFSWPEDQPATAEISAKPSGPAVFYVNLYAGELSLDFPRQKKMVQGGILADEMGLGKTISTMSLIHSNRFSEETEYSQLPSSQVLRERRERRGDFARYTTLIVAPMSLLSQWESEALAASKPGTTRVLVYYGNTASSVNLRSLLCGPKADTEAPHVVVTSYGTLASEHSTLLQYRRRHLQRQATGRSIDGSQKSVNGRLEDKKGRVWEDMGHQAWEDDEDLGLFGLYGVEFFRVVLDEGHTIKNRATKTAKACYDIRSQRRWILTGTPIVNRLEDLFSLIKFLGAEPWNNFSFWKTFITVPFMNKELERALTVVQSVMEPILLRRTKDMRGADGKPLVELPSKEVHVVPVTLSQEERDVYDLIFASAKSAFDKNVRDGTVMKSYTTILAQILRLRQACCHPTMVTDALLAQKLLPEADSARKSKIEDIVAQFNSIDSAKSVDEVISSSQAAEKFEYEVLTALQEGTPLECAICLTEDIPHDDMAVTECWHVSCMDCLLKHIDVSKLFSSIGILSNIFLAFDAKRYTAMSNLLG